MSKEFKTWNSVKEENQKLGKDTDQRIWNNIEGYINKRKNLRRFYWSAAAIIPFIIGTFIITTDQIKEDYKSIAYKTQKKRMYALKDGSIVTLEPGSSLVLNEQFGTTNRDVTFRGKAYFKVSKNKRLPFKINANNFRVEVLGTQFYLDQESKEYQVHLTEGKVKINYKNKQIFLTPKQIWKTNENGDDYVYLETTVKKEFSFKNQKYSEVIENLEKVYLVKIKYPEEYKNEIVSGSAGGNLEEILTIISFPFDLQLIKIDNQNIEMKK